MNPFRILLIILHIRVYLGVGGFLPAVKQIGNVAALPGIVGVLQYAYTYMYTYMYNICITSMHAPV